MSPEPVTAERVYARLKADIMRGRFPPRTTLVTQMIADDYGTSISPVRDSLQRLIGERLLAAHAGGGFEVPDMPEAALYDLYSWHGELLAIACRRPDRTESIRESPPGGAVPRPDTIADRAASLFDDIATCSSNGELRATVHGTGDRLHLVRLCEPLVMPGVAEELETIESRFRSGPVSDMRNAIKAYHRRRLRRVGQLHAMLHNPERLRSL